jgi:hypothetical protein
MFFGYSLMGGDSGGSALHWSEDGYRWTTDHRKLGRWMIRADNKCLFPHHGTVVFFQGMYWFLGVYANIVSGTQAKISRIAMAPLADLRTPFGKPRILVAPDGDCEADDLRSVTVFSENGRLYVYYSCATSQASWVNCAVIEDGASGETGGFEEALLISAQPTPLVMSLGNISGALSVSASATDGSELSYQWYSNTSAINQDGTAIEGATEASYTLPTDLNEGYHYYYCLITSATLNGISSNVATVTVGPRPTIAFTQQPVDASAVAGSIASSLSTSASASDGSTVSYQWYQNTADNSVNGTLIPGATGADFAIPTSLAAGTYFYYCVASAPIADPISSEAASVVITPRPNVTITAQPASMSFSEGDITGSLSITANASDGNDLSYQWYSNTVNSSQGGLLVEGASEAEFALPSNLAVGVSYYYCAVTCGASVTLSEVAAVTVRAATYLARYTLTGEAGAEMPATLADESGNENAALSVLGITAYDSLGHVNLNGAEGNGLKITGLNLGGADSYKLHVRFVSKDGSTGISDGVSHRLINIPGVDFNLMLVTASSTTDCFKLETTNTGYVTQTSTSTPSGIRRRSISVLDVDVRVANDVATIIGTGESFTGVNFTISLSNVSIPGLTAALSDTLYIGNREDGTRPVNGSVTELYVQETTFVSLAFTAQPANTRCAVGSVSGELTALAEASDGSAVSYQWYENTESASVGGTLVDGATGSIFALPANLTKGDHYYYCVATCEAAGSVSSTCATVTAVQYIAKYVLTGMAGEAAPATIADSSGNGNTALTVNGVSAYGDQGNLSLSAAGQSLYIPSIANLPTNYKLHMGFRKETMNQHRLFVIPAHDLNTLIGNVNDDFSSLHIKLESSSADAGFVSPISICNTNVYHSLTGYIPVNANLDIEVAGDSLTTTFNASGTDGLLYGTNITTVVGFTAALAQGIYLGNREAGDRQLGGAVTEFWIEEV